MPAPVRVQSLDRGAFYMVLSALLFAGMSAAVKAASATLPNSMVVFFRNAVSLVALLPLALRHGPRALATRHLGEHLVRGVGGLLAMYCFFYAIAHLRLADAVLLNYSLPLLIPFVERAWLGEPVPHRLWRPLSVGFLGIVLILRPGSEVFHPAALVALLAAGFGAVAQVGVRRLTHSEPITRIVFYFALIATSLSALPLAHTWTAPGAPAWAALLTSGVLATGGQLALTRAYSHAPASRVGPFLYSGVVFSGALDWLIWGRLPDALFLMGASLVVAAGALALRLRDDGLAEPAG
jgi:drug/metabolite transporter (DMT)-like permease